MSRSRRSSPGVDELGMDEDGDRFLVQPVSTIPIDLGDKKEYVNMIIYTNEAVYHVQRR